MIVSQALHLTVLALVDVSALTAVPRKLLTTLNANLRDNRPWQNA